MYPLPYPDADLESDFSFRVTESPFDSENEPHNTDYSLVPSRIAPPFPYTFSLPFFLSTREPTTLQHLSRTIRSYVPSPSPSYPASGSSGLPVRVSSPSAIHITSAAPSPPLVSKPVSFGSFMTGSGTIGGIIDDHESHLNQANASGEGEYEVTRAHPTANGAARMFLEPETGIEKRRGSSPSPNRDLRGYGGRYEGGGVFIEDGENENRHAYDRTVGRGYSSPNTSVGSGPVTTGTGGVTSYPRTDEGDTILWARWDTWGSK